MLMSDGKSLPQPSFPCLVRLAAAQRRAACGLIRLLCFAGCPRDEHDDVGQPFHSKAHSELAAVGCACSATS